MWTSLVTSVSGMNRAGYSRRADAQEVEPRGLNGFSRKKSGKQKGIGWYAGCESLFLQSWSMGG